MKQKIVVAVGGNGGSHYARTLLDRLAARSADWQAVGVVLTDDARRSWETEQGAPFRAEDYPELTIYGKKNFLAPFASGSAMYHTMIVCPCPLGVLGRIATGVSDDLITRAADVVLKERRRLLLVPHETPYSLIHLRNMVDLTEAGAIVCPAAPEVTTTEQTASELVNGLIDHVLSLAGLPTPSHGWGAK